MEPDRVAGVHPREESGRFGVAVTDRRSSASTGWLVAAILAAIIALPLIAAPGIPLFLHDWVWSPYAARTLWGAQFLYSAWTQPGLGNPNSAISVNPLA